MSIKTITHQMGENVILKRKKENQNGNTRAQLMGVHIVIPTLENKLALYINLKVGIPCEPAINSSLREALVYVISRHIRIYYSFDFKN